MRIGYNTNGFAHHRLEDALCILATLGYRSVALTLDYHALNPYAPEFDKQRVGVGELLDGLGLHCVIETGARFLLNPMRKHWPTLLSAESDGRDLRLDFLRRAVDAAAGLPPHVVSFWSGTPDDGGDYSTHFNRLADGCRQLCEYAAPRGVRLAFEPEPGMLIDTMTRFADLHRAVAHPSFGLTLDVGHLHCLGETPIAAYVRTWAPWLWNVHIEDMRRGVHDHLMFGEGEMEFPPILRALAEVGYAGGLHVELSRHSHDAVNTARRALQFLTAAAKVAIPRIT